MTMYLPTRPQDLVSFPEFAVRVEHQHRTVSVVGDLDISSADELVARTAELTATPGDVVLDLGGVAFLCAAGIGAIVRIRNAQQAHQSRLLLHNVPASIRRTLVHGGADELLAEVA